MDGQMNSESRVVRDKAITLLYETLKEVRDWAKVIYKHNLKVRREFLSRYMHLKTTRTKNLHTKYTLIDTSIVTQEHAIEE